MLFSPSKRCSQGRKGVKYLKNTGRVATSRYTLKFREKGVYSHTSFWDPTVTGGKVR